MRSSPCQPDNPRAAYSVQEFCAAHRISPDFFFKLRRVGKAPKMMKVGTRSLISVEAAAQWRRDRERDAEIEPADQQPSPEE